MSSQIQNAYEDGRESGYREGFKDGYLTAKEELENLLGTYGETAMLWSEVLRWLRRPYK